MGAGTVTFFVASGVIGPLWSRKTVARRLGSVAIQYLSVGSRDSHLNMQLDSRGRRLMRCRTSRLSPCAPRHLSCASSSVKTSVAPKSSDGQITKHIVDNCHIAVCRQICRDMAKAGEQRSAHRDAALFPKLHPSTPHKTPPHS